MPYIVHSNSRAITGVTFFPLKSRYSADVSFASFHASGQICVHSDRFHINSTAGVSMVACSLHTQNGIESGPVAVHLILDKALCT